MDKYDEQASLMLPCSCRGSMYQKPRGAHFITCSATHRPAVALTLRAQGQRIEELEALLKRFALLDHQCGDSPLLEPIKCDFCDRSASVMWDLARAALESK